MNILKNIKNSAIFKGSYPLAGSILAGIFVGICLLGIVMPEATKADFANTANASYVAKAANEVKKPLKTIKVIITAYSSEPNQTDDTPFITASGKYVGDGIIANNLLPFGTKVKIPALYGDKIFTVQDRMNKKKGNYHVDIWMPSTPQAINFGAKTADIVVIED